MEREGRGGGEGESGKRNEGRIEVKGIGEKGNGRGEGREGTAGGEGRGEREGWKVKGERGDGGKE